MNASDGSSASKFNFLIMFRVINAETMGTFSRLPVLLSNKSAKAVMLIFSKGKIAKISRAILNLTFQPIKLYFPSVRVNPRMPDKSVNPKPFMFLILNEPL